MLRYARTEEGSRLVDVDQPYGAGDFGEVGGWVRLQLDTRAAYREGMATRTGIPGPFGKAGYPAKGFLLEAIAAGFPKAWDVEKSYGWLEGSAATYLTVGPKGRATLALRAGRPAHARRQVPVLQRGVDRRRRFLLRLRRQSAGFRPNRFIGDSSLYFNGELRLYLSRFFVALPGEWGLFGFGDVGRVWLAGEMLRRLAHELGRRHLDRAPLALERGRRHGRAERRADRVLREGGVQLLATRRDLGVLPRTPQIQATSAVAERCARAPDSRFCSGGWLRPIRRRKVRCPDGSGVHPSGNRVLTP